MYGRGRAREPDCVVGLSARIQAAPDPPGDATLVHRLHEFPDRPSFTGKDLYMDDGGYFFGATLGELQDAYRHRAFVEDGAMSRLQVARAALTLDPKTGVLTRMVGGVPGKAPSVVVTYTIRRVTAADAMR